MDYTADDDLNITDLIEVDTLQRIQDAFAEMTGMAALVTDVYGVPVTKSSNFTDFCMKYTRKSPVGRQRCEWCDRFGAEQTLESGCATTYFCHAGLIDFAAPIVVNNKHVGCFIGGQVLTKPMTEKRIRQVAKDLDIEPEGYIAAAKKVHIRDKHVIDKAADFLYKISYVLSDIAYGTYQTNQANIEIEKASKMKSDFLANMSHEIRTPMNAVIGMAEMALREDLPPVARDYIHQIKSSGRELLTIINDILDFSKIESGKMDICPVEYESMSIINDVVNIIMTRLHDKDVELILDLEPTIPKLLYGDNIRIKQILINIANNAVKFTNSGKVTILTSYEQTAEDMIEMRMSVEDTGIGIKKNDLDKLFQSFQQVDSKRNRNIEGTGLGLAISKRLLNLMGGDIRVESEYGVGSTFTFFFPQKIIDKTPSISIPDAGQKYVAALIYNEKVKEQLAKDCATLGVHYFFADDADTLTDYAEQNLHRELFVMLDRKMFTEEWSLFAERHPEVKLILIIDFFDTTKYDFLPNLMVMKKPIYTLNLATLLKGGDLHALLSDDKNTALDFIAPDAEVLIVDDNAVNLTIAEGLLEPLKMKIQTSLSGKDAVNKISEHRFDLIFMDHMMPEMDGVETTRVIRRFHDDYNDVPIIALTANAVDGTKEMFLREGMNDFVAKPIELHTLIAKVRQWLPIEKIKRLSPDEIAQNADDDDVITIGDLDTQSAIQLLGSKSLFWKILESYYQSIEKKAAQIKELQMNGDWSGYTIEVHALKSLSKQIGAMELSEIAAEMERAGNARNTDLIRQHTDKMLERYRGYIPVLKPFFPSGEEEDESQKEPVTPEILKDFFAQMREAADNLDMDLMESIILEMHKYQYDDTQKDLYEQLKAAVDEVDTDSCTAIVDEWESSMQ